MVAQVVVFPDQAAVDGLVGQGILAFLCGAPPRGDQGADLGVACVVLRQQDQPRAVFEAKTAARYQLDRTAAPGAAPGASTGGSSHGAGAGGSVVAHGPGISVNGQDPRANVYLLDGTLLNDFTNGPAGSAASTALTAGCQRMSTGRLNSQ